MSFDYNPYKHIELVVDDNGMWSVYCHSCGSEEVAIGDIYTPLMIFFDAMRKHLRENHGTEPDYYDGWSKY